MAKSLFKVVAALALMFGSAKLAADGLTWDRAQEMIARAIERADELDLQISVAVVDQHGQLKAFARMDGAHLITCESARRKAYTSAVFPMSSAEMAKYSENPGYRAIADIPGVLLLGGGVPIFSPSGEHIGGIGVGGGYAEADEACATYALGDGD